MSAAGLKGALVGCRGMGRWHAKSLHACREVALVAICDLDEGRAREAAGEFAGVRAYADFDKMLAEERLDILAIATPNTSHAALAIQAAEAGVRGICCEKPMAVDLGSARAMRDACERHGARLIINHQRRTLASLVRMRELIADGAIGEVTLFRGTCQGDLLTDGTHVVDSLLHLAGDVDAAWVFGALYRLPPPNEEERGMGFYATGGYRYGHPVESGAWGTWESVEGARFEVLTGGLHLPGRQYNDYEVLGTRGRLWRTGDRDKPGVLIQAAGSEEWRPIDVDAGDESNVIEDNYDLLARNVRAVGGEHPLGIDRALRGFEILMAIFESARRRERINLPLDEERFPLQMMIDDGML